METIEATGATVQEAIEAGMAELGVDNPSQVMVEVLQEPDRGIMGEGAKLAIVRLLFMGVRSGTQSGTSIVADSEVPQETPITTISSYDGSDIESDTDDSDAEAFFGQDREVSIDDVDDDARVGKDVLEELLSKMEIEGTVKIRLAESTRAGESNHWVLAIEGPKMNMLIGRRGETLASLQYITRLIVSRRLQRRASIIVDAGNYKADRSRRLHKLATRMADQAVRQRRTVTLEPMPPHERRIIHLTLRNRDDVTTKSIGEGDGRKVTISPMP